MVSVYQTAKSGYTTVGLPQYSRSVVDLFKQVNMNVVITGASKGIGKAMANIFAANGHQLFLCSRNEEVLNKTREELLTQYPSVTIHAKAFDLSKNAKEFGIWVLEKGIEVDVLINNAGSFEPGSVYNEPEKLLENQLATNLYSAYHLTRTLLPDMMKRRSGHVFNICSIAALKAYPNGGAYSISKFAFTDSWGNFDNTADRIMVPEDIAKMVYAASQLSPAACVEEIVIRPQLGDL